MSASFCDRLAFEPRILRAGNAAVGAWIRMIAWCATYRLDDAVVSKRAVRMFATRREIARGIDAGLFRRLDSGAIELLGLDDLWRVDPIARTSFPKTMRSWLYDRDDGVCGICKTPVEPEDMHIDHVIPIARGGSNTPANLQIAHSTCNLRKGTS